MNTIIRISEDLCADDSEISFQSNCRFSRAAVRRVFNGKQKSLKCLIGYETVRIRFNKSGSTRVGCSLFSKEIVRKIRAWAFARRKKVSGK